MKRFDSKQLAGAGLMAALVMVGTMLVQVPTPTKGYIHVGDSMVYLSGILLGPAAGALASAVGSLLADVFSGYGIYAPATFFIKGLDALAAGLCYRLLVSSESLCSRKLLAFGAAVLAGGAVMVSGYLAYETFLYGFGTAVLGVPANITQAAGGGILAAPLLLALDRMKFLKDS
ncbi:MAG: ECF transporter S component [Peptococcaceae bacterium]|nr:ECF transporter S component [Peptococcaceae bacterium]MDH7525891.1 ECF transporter S component [Peptococcaceae bacterium]